MDVEGGEVGLGVVFGQLLLLLCLVRDDCFEVSVVVFEPLAKHNYFLLASISNLDVQPMLQERHQNLDVPVAWRMIILLQNRSNKVFIL